MKHPRAIFRGLGSLTLQRQKISFYAVNFTPKPRLQRSKVRRAEEEQEYKC